MSRATTTFLAGAPFAVVGASADRNKYGNKVLRCYQQHEHRVFAVNPRGGEIEGVPTYSCLSDIPEPVHGVSIITQPHITEQVVAEAIILGIKNIWMQPGAESQAAINAAEEAGINIIAGGPCLLVVLGYHEPWP